MAVPLKSIRTLLRVRLIPRSKISCIEGWMDEQTLKVRVQAPPVDGKANQALLRTLADALHWPASRFSIIAGQSSRNKTVEIEGMDREGLRSRLQSVP